MPLAQLSILQLHYEHTASPNETPALVLLHGMGSSSADWALQVPHFAQRHRVLTVDLRAHGHSTDPGSWFTIEQMAADVAELLTLLNEHPAHVVGLSLGGCVALALAVHQPRWVRSLTLVNAFARYQPVGRRGVMRQARRLWLLLTAPMSAVAAYIAGGLFPHPEQKPFYEAAVASLSQNRKRTYFASMRALAMFDARPHLPHLRCPTLIVAGERDTTVAHAAQHVLHQNIPGAQFCLLHNSGHASPYDQAEAFNRAVLEFIGRH